MNIAGHTFVDTPGGRCCTLCGRRWTSIASATEVDIGRDGIAHTGALNAAELNQIVAERERIYATIADVAGGRR
jgi:hypothetical protein